MQIASSIQLFEEILNNAETKTKNRNVLIVDMSIINSLVLHFVLSCRGPSKIIKTNAKPTIDAIVNIKVFITNLLWS